MDNLALKQFQSLMEFEAKQIIWNKIVAIKITNEGAIGCVGLNDTKNIEISLNPEFPLLKEIKEEDDKLYILKGILAHELLHIIYTNINIYNFRNKSCPRLFHDIVNIVEDGAIEYRSQRVLPEHFDVALKYTVRTLANLSDPCESDDIVQKIIAMMIEFTDIGIIKTQVPEDHKELAINILKMTYKAMIKNGEERADLCEQIYSALLPFVKEDSSNCRKSEDLSEFNTGKNDDEKHSGKSNNDKSNDGSKDKSDDKSEDTSNGGSDDESDDGSNGNSKDGSEEKSEDKEISESIEKAFAGSSSNNKDETKDGSDGSSEDNSEEKSEEDEELQKAKDEFTQNLKNQKIVELKKYSELMRDRSLDQENSPLENYIVDPGSFSINAYDKIVAENKTAIQKLAKTFNKLVQEKEKSYYATSGKLNIRRINTERPTARVFNKKELSFSNSLDVMLLIDLSGSMCGNKIDYAKRTLICLSEALSIANIDFKIIGFHSYSQYHIVNWKNTKMARVPIVDLEAGGSNYDALTMEYGVNELLERKKENKIMFVISDGQPCCDIEYCIKAINKGEKKGIKIFGIAIDGDMEAIESMYHRFVAEKDLTQLLNVLKLKLEREFKRLAF